jgi:hypothetical protein
VIWFSVWATLVVATLVGAALLGLSLWRKGKALLAQLQETNQVMEQLQSKIEALEAAREAAQGAPAPLLDLGFERDRWRTVRVANRGTRRARRDRRREQAYSRWHEVFDTN